MASKTTNYGLNKHSPQDFYNVEARNENWDKIDEALAATDPTKITAKAEPADGDGVMIADSADGGKAKRLLWSNVKAALGKLFVPLARKINGKTLAKDVTLTAEDVGAVPISGDNMTGALGLGEGGATHGSTGAFEDVYNVGAYLEAFTKENRKARLQLEYDKTNTTMNDPTGIVLSYYKIFPEGYKQVATGLHTGNSVLAALTPNEATPAINGQVFWQYG